MPRKSQNAEIIPANSPEITKSWTQAQRKAAIGAIESRRKMLVDNIEAGADGTKLRQIANARWGAVEEVDTKKWPTDLKSAWGAIRKASAEVAPKLEILETAGQKEEFDYRTKHKEVLAALDIRHRAAAEALADQHKKEVIDLRSTYQEKASARTQARGTKIHNLEKTQTSAELAWDKAVSEYNAAVREEHTEHQLRLRKVIRTINEEASEQKLRIEMDGLGDKTMEFLDSLAKPEDAVKIAKMAGLPFNTVDFQKAIAMSDC